MNDRGDLSARPDGDAGTLQGAGGTHAYAGLTPRGVRFSPPEVRLDAELRWVLRRAFCGGEVATKPLVDPRTALRYARNLGVAARIGASIPSAQLEAEAGSLVAGAFIEESREAATEQVKLRGLTAITARAVRAAGSEMVVLKGMALDQLGVCRLGSRLMIDLDVLVSSGRAAEVHSQLLAAGLAEADLFTPESIFGVFIHPGGVTVDVHLRVPGVDTAGTGQSSDLTSVAPYTTRAQIDGAELTVLVPTEDVLIAHLVVHGVAQHGWMPVSYPLTRTIADLIDVGFHRIDSQTRLEAIHGYIERDVSREELHAMRDLCRALAAGDDSILELEGEQSDAQKMLAHVIAGEFDLRYRDGLMLHWFMSPLTDGPAPLTFVRRAARRLFPKRGELRMIYGPARSLWERLSQRVRRPFDVAAIFLHHYIASVRRPRPRVKH